jgi:hypothetical protein
MNHFHSDYFLLGAREMSSCVIWEGGKTGSGYGAVKIKGRTRGAHIVSYEEHKGSVPKGLFVMHSCDNPACVNHKHLFLGTPKDNTHDMMRKGRMVTFRGEQLPQHKLTEVQVQQLRSSHKRGDVSQKVLADAYGISQSAVSLIVNNKRWLHTA